jgi:hypothetical protein
MTERLGEEDWFDVARAHNRLVRGTERVGRWDFGPATLLSLKGLSHAECVYALDWRAA